MSILTDLEAALEAFMAAEDAYYGYDRSDIVLLARLLDEKMSTRSTLISRLLTDDTIATLIAVVDEVTRRAPILVADPENDRLLNLAAALTRAPLVKEADDDRA